MGVQYTDRKGKVHGSREKFMQLRIFHFPTDKQKGNGSFLLGEKVINFLFWTEDDLFACAPIGDDDHSEFYLDPIQDGDSEFPSGFSLTFPADVLPKFRADFENDLARRGSRNSSSFGHFVTKRNPHWRRLSMSIRKSNLRSRSVSRLSGPE